MVRKTTASIFQAKNWEDYTLDNLNMKAKIDDMQQTSKCGLYEYKDKTIYHTISECSTPAQKECKTRHDWAGRLIYWELCKIWPYYQIVNAQTRICPGEGDAFEILRYKCYILTFWPGQKCHSKVMHRKEMTHSNGSYEKKSRGQILADEMGRAKKFPWYPHRLMHRKRVTSELHDSYFRLMTIKHSISKIEWASNAYITQLSSTSQLSSSASWVEDRTEL